MLTERQITILKAVARHYTLTIAQIRRLIFKAGQDRDGRITRRLMTSLLHSKLVNKCRCEVVNPLHGLTAPVYYPSRAGCEMLTVVTGDARYLLTPTQTPNWMNLRHWTILSDLRMLVDDAIAAQSRVQLAAFFNEFDVVNRDAEDPAERYRLYTRCSAPHERKIVCCPDVGFALAVNAATRAFYGEIETGSNSPAKCSNEKRPGYAALEQQRLHLRHFPNASDFRVLCFTPDTVWRDALRREFRNKQGAHLWRFAALTELRSDTFLHAPLFYPAGDGAATPLVKGGAA